MRFTPDRPRRPFHQPPGRENAVQHAEYARVKAILANRTDKAVLLSREDLVQPVWLPKHALDIGSRVAVERAPLKTEIQIAVELKRAQESGLV